MNLNNNALAFFHAPGNMVCSHDGLIANPNISLSRMRDRSDDDNKDCVYLRSNEVPACYCYLIFTWNLDGPIARWRFIRKSHETHKYCPSAFISFRELSIFPLQRNLVSRLRRTATAWKPDINKHIITLKIYMHETRFRPIVTAVLCIVQTSLG